MIESPYSGDIDRNMRYLELCGCETTACYGELHYASHSYMTQHPRAKNYYVSDYDPKWTVVGRDPAIAMSQEMRRRCDMTVFYTDLGWSSGMKSALEYCKKYNLPYTERKLNREKLAERVPYCTIEFINAVVDGGHYTSYLE